jgi:hypothetical protein
MTTASCNDTHFSIMPAHKQFHWSTFCLHTHWLRSWCHRHKTPIQLLHASLSLKQIWSRKKAKQQMHVENKSLPTICFVSHAIRFHRQNMLHHWILLVFRKERKVESFFIRPSKSDQKPEENHAQNNNHMMSYSDVIKPKKKSSCNVIYFIFTSLSLDIVKLTVTCCDATKQWMQNWAF